ncbi:hypothetical protein K438DRAFT_1783057 [Mycena galopus ATCC 62051]|nr:hypothetical protein K438DRAFT_1783057 [Mycena galopus ATCC 62051]
MTTMHAPPPNANLVPTIPSGALPQTPASVSGEDMADLMAGHVNRTPAVPGVFPHHLEPDVQDTKSGNTDNDTGNAGVRNPPAQGSLLETAQATLAAATSFLFPGLASYLPASPEATKPIPASESSLPPFPPSESSVSTLPPQDTAVSNALSTTVHTGDIRAARRFFSHQTRAPPPRAPHQPHHAPPHAPDCTSASHTARHSQTAGASTPSLVPSTGGDSGYAASTETEVGTPAEGARAGQQGSATLNSARLADTVPTGHFSAPSASSPVGSPGPGVGGSAALNSAHLVDTVPTSNIAAPSALSPVGGPGVGVRGSAALNSARLADTVSTGDVTPGVEADVDEPESGSGGANDTAGASNGDGKEKKSESTKSNLIQRFKQKMHVGRSSSS